MMNLGLLLVCFLVAVTLSCHSKGTQGEETRSVPHSPAPPQLLDAADTSGCHLVANVVHPDPYELVAEYLRRDAAGDFTSSNDWDASSKTCPGHEPGWDKGTLITSYRIDRLTEHRDTAKYLVTYEVYSPLDQDSVGFVLRPSPRQEVHTFVVLRTPYGWRIDSPVIDPHLSPQGALGHGRFGESDRRLLRNLIRQH